MAPLDQVVLLGELGLDGTVRPVRGALPMVAAVARTGHHRVIVPFGNATEAGMIPGVRIHAVRTLRQLADFLTDGIPLPDPPQAASASCTPTPDLADLAGQGLGRRALEVAAAGGHHLALLGPPGAGKSMLAERLPSVLPELPDDAAMEVTSLHSIAGLLPPEGQLIRRPPFQAPHHTATVSALIGGGTGLARPGAVSLAHRGVLLLDEAPEFNRNVLDALRQPLEHGRVRLARSRGTAEYPARIQLVLAANPCPCAKPSGDVSCDCTPLARRRYLGRLSGPLLDRVDIQVTVRPVRAAELTEEFAGGEPSAVVAARVATARAAAVERWSSLGRRSNAEMPGPVLRRPPWRLPGTDIRELRARLDRGSLSARGFDRVLRLAWTIADLDGRERPDAEDIREAIGLRTGEAL